MCSALAHQQALDERTANRAIFAFAPINVEMILKIAPAIDPIDAGAVALDAFDEDAANSF